jgi:ATP-dependent helicase HrpA
MLFAGEILGCLRELLVIASALEVQDVRERPLDRQQQADQAHALYRDADSDFSGLLMLWRYVNEQREALSSNQFRKLCKRQFLSWMRLREWRDTHQQLSRIVKEMGMKSNHQPAGYDAIHQALLSGLLSHIGHKDEDRTYQGARDTRFRIFPGSGVSKKSPDWIVAAEIVETSQVFARTVARIEPRWIEQAAQHLVQRQYTEPHWYARKGYVSARESVSLYGLILASNRRVNYGTVNPEHARAIFIEQALVAREYDSKAAFWKHNGLLLEDIESLEHRQRRRDVLVDDVVIYRFYDEQIPEGIHNRHSFEKWRKKAEQQNPEVLYMTRELLMRHDAIGVSRERYPDHLSIRGNDFPLQYHFNPGHEVDGVSVEVPAILLAGLEQSDFDWLVPGLLFEKIVALIKSLPKTIRKQFVPAPDFAQACIEVIEYGKGNLVEQITQQLKRMTGYALQSTDFQPEQIPEHLHLNFNVTDASGHILAMGRNLTKLQHQLHDSNVPDEILESPEHEWTRDGIQRWDFGPLPETIEVRHGKQRLNMYPAIWDCGDTVSLELCTSAAEAGQHTHWGVLRLAYLTLTDQRKALFRRFRELQQYLLEYSLLPENELLMPPTVISLMDDWMEHCVYLSFQLAAPKDVQPSDPSGFEAFIGQIRGRLLETGEQLLQSIQQTMLKWQQLRILIGDIQQHETIYHDVQQQLAWLLYQGFVHDIHNDWIFEYPRFMQALIVRLQRYRNDPPRDERLMLQVKPYQEAYVQSMTEWLAEGYDYSELDDIRWALENYRVSLFAQELKTRQPVSAKRMQTLFTEFSIPVKGNN